MNTTITRQIEWEMGHRLPSHGSLCRFIHGHHYKAEVTIEGPIIEQKGSSEQGMVRDFGALKTVMSDVIQGWDHGLMLSTTDPWLATLRELDTKLIEVEFIPTAECIAAEMFRRLSAIHYQLNLIQVTIWETPNCKATVSTLSHVK